MKKVKETSSPSSSGAKRKRTRSNTVASSSGVLRFKGCGHFRARVVCSLLSGRALVIEDIRPFGISKDGGGNGGDKSSGHEAPEIGLLEFEASFLRLVDILTNGTKVEINETGTTLRFKPGVITGGRVVHDCGVGKSVGWFMEGIVPLGLFSKKGVEVHLSGITNDDDNISVDVIKAVTLPLLTLFGVGADGGLDIKIKTRGAPPLGGGLVELRVPVVRELRTLNLTDAGLIKRVRGNAYCAKVSPQVANRVAESARGVLNRLLPDVWVHTDHYSGVRAGKSPGFALALVTESTTGVITSAEIAATKGSLPEDVGKKGSVRLLEEVKRGGCVDSSHQWLALLLMVLGPEDVGKVRLGELTPYTVGFLRLLRSAFGTVFKLSREEQDGTTLAVCLGIGYKNISRKAT